MRPGQFVVFSKDAVTGVPCDAEGREFASASDATLLVFDELEDAREFCERRVADQPSIQFDLYDSDGKANPPLMTIVNASRAERRDEHPQAFRRRRRIAVGLIVFTVVFLIFGYVVDKDGTFVLPFVLGVPLLVAAGRLLLMNLGIRDTERERQKRLARVPSREGTATPPLLLAIALVASCERRRTSATGRATQRRPYFSRTVLS